MPRCSRTASSASGRCAPRRRPTGSSSAAASDTFEPTLTFHGFRYAEVTGWPGELTPTTLEAVVVALRPAPHRQLRVLRPAAQPAAPQRRLGRCAATSSTCRPTARSATSGWAGPATSPVFAPTAAYLYDVAGFLARLAGRPRPRAAATPTGMVPFVVPDVLKYMPTAAGVPRAGHDRGLERRRRLGALGALRRRTATAAVLERQYPTHDRARPPGRGTLSRRPASVGHRLPVRRLARPGRAARRAVRAKADTGVVATACLLPHRARSWPRPPACWAAPTTRREFAALADRTRARVQRRTTSPPTARVLSDCATVYALAIAFGLLDGRAAQRRGRPAGRAGRGRAATASRPGSPARRSSATRSTTTGHLDDAYGLLLQRECPSWLYPVTMGATTIWERWDSMLPDGSINPGEMTSLQPLRAGRGRRLDAPHHRRHRPARARL